MKSPMLELPVYDDLNFSPLESGGPAVTLPDDVLINGVYHKEFTSANNQRCGAGHELPHIYQLGEPLYIHAHIFLKSGENAGTTGVTFTIYWELRQSTGTTYGSKTLTATSAQLSANAHKIDIYADESIDGADELGAQLRLQIARTAGDAGDVIVQTYGIHFGIDAMGSREITSK